MYRRLGGIIDAVDPNREIGFGFVSCSCRACVRACEAVRVRERCAPQRWRLEREEVGLRRGFYLGAFRSIRVFFKYFRRCCCYMRGFFDQCWDMLAIVVGFKPYKCFFGRYRCYMRRFVDQCWDIIAICVGFSSDNLISWSQHIIPTSDPHR